MKMGAEEKIKEKLREIMDPHTGTNIVDMGLITEVKVKGKRARITFIPTSPFCPITEYFKSEIKKLAESLPGIKKADVVCELPNMPEQQ